MANLFTRDEFAVWCQTPIASDDAFATAVMDNATALVVDAASAPGWELDPTTAPRRAKLIALRVARRTYLNPDQEISSSVGPISASIARDAAAGMALTEDELEQLEEMAPGGDPNAAVLWVQRTTRGPLEDELPLVMLRTEAGDYMPYAFEGETGAFGDLVSGEGVDPADFAALQALVESLQTSLAAKASTAALTAAVTPKADKSYVDAQDATKASTTALTSGLATKADTSALTAKADKTYVDAELADKAEQSDLTAGLATKASTSALTTGLATKADTTVTDGLDTRLDAAETAIAGKASQADLDDLFGEVELKANAADLGPQIEADDTQPTSGSGKLWADTTGL